MEMENEILATHQQITRRQVGSHSLYDGFLLFFLMDMPADIC